MSGLSRVDRSLTPPGIHIPRQYNAAHDLIERNLGAGRGDKLAYIDDAGSYTFNDLARRVDRFANVLARLGVEREERVMVCLLDAIDFPSVFLGAIKAGVVPIAANTLLTPTDYEYMLRDSGAEALIVSKPLWPQFAHIVRNAPALCHVIISGG